MTWHKLYQRAAEWQRCFRAAIRAAIAAGSMQDDDEANAEIELIADILEGIFGDDALKMIDEMTIEASWDEDKHPRGANGRFIPKGSTEAVATAKDAIKKTLKEPKTSKTVSKLLGHLDILTVKQLQELKKEYGLSASGKNRAELIAKIADRLGKGRMEAPDVKSPSSEKQANKKPEKRKKEAAKPTAEDAPSVPPPMEKLKNDFEEAFRRVESRQSLKNFVNLVQLRKEFGEDRETFNRVMNELRRDSKYTMEAAEGRFGVTPEEREAGVTEHGILYLYLSRRNNNDDWRRERDKATKQDQGANVGGDKQDDSPIQQAMTEIQSDAHKGGHGVFMSDVWPKYEAELDKLTFNELRRAANEVGINTIGNLNRRAVMTDIRNAVIEKHGEKSAERMGFEEGDEL